MRSAAIFPGPTFESRRDRARFVRSPAFGGIEIMHARFVDHAFAPHTHDELMIGVIYHGVKRFRRERQTHHVTRYGLSTNNAGDLHTGERAAGEMICYSALYLTEQVLRDIGLPDGFAITSAVINDPGVWTQLARAVSASERLEVEEAIVAGLNLVAVRHGELKEHRRVIPGGIAKAIDSIHARYDENLSLADIAKIANLSVRHLIRSFEIQTGLTPHRYLRNVRIERARGFLRRGEAPASVAARTGFTDQAHLTRVFRKLVGATPGDYRLVHPDRSN